MRKMPCLLQRDFHGSNSFTLREEVTPGCEWVLKGEGHASHKWDGTACFVKDGLLWKRYDAKKDRKTGEYKLPPKGALPCSEPDEVTGHWPHWVLTGEHDYWHNEAFQKQKDTLVEGATYELCGPKISANPHGFAEHVLVRHGDSPVDVLNQEGSRTLEQIATSVKKAFMEGIVFVHPDGRFCKIRRKDYGLDWPIL